MLKLVFGLSQAIIHDRVERRKVSTGLLIFLLAITALGAWPMAAWLDERPVIFILWWLFVGFLTLMLLIMAAYDALISIHEERKK